MASRVPQLIESLEKKVLNFPTGGLACSNGGYSTLIREA